MRRLAPVSLCLIIVACSSETVPSAFDPDAKAKQQAAQERAADRVATDAGFQPNAPAPIRTVDLDAPKTDTPGSMLPPGDRQYRYIGRWAATPARCQGGAWEFKSRKLATAGETSCDFTTVAAVPTGYRLEAMCQAEGMKTAQTLQVAFNDDQRSMTIRGKTLGPATLIYCGD